MITPLCDPRRSRFWPDRVGNSSLSVFLPRYFAKARTVYLVRQSWAGYCFNILSVTGQSLCFGDGAKGTAHWGKQTRDRCGKERSLRRGISNESRLRHQLDRRRNCRWQPRMQATEYYEWLSIWVRSSAIEPNRTVPCGNCASMEPSA